MKYLFCVFAIVLGVGSSYAQSINIDKIPPKDRHVILIEIAQNVAETLGPGYASYFGKPIVSPPQKLCRDDYDDSSPEIRKNLGRAYYTVTFPYDSSIVKFEFDYAAEVRIWKDTGEPMDVTFGNGMGRNFFSSSFEEQTNRPLRFKDRNHVRRAPMSSKTIEVVPLQTRDEEQSIWN